MLFQPFPQIMRIGFRHSAPLTVLFGWHGREFFLAPGQDVAIAFLQVLVFNLGEFFAFSLGHPMTGLLQQSLYIARPGIAMGANAKGQLP